jgi:hypothetical protein
MSDHAIEARAIASVLADEVKEAGPPSLAAGQIPAELLIRYLMPMIKRIGELEATVRELKTVHQD